MKRFWLSLLVLVLSLQMGLAAAHLCADDMPAAATTQGQPAGEPAATASKAQTQAAANPLSDACCTGSVCHELHNAVSVAASSLNLSSDAGVLNQSQARLAQHDFAVRHERPQWSAA